MFAVGSLVSDLHGRGTALSTSLDGDDDAHKRSVVLKYYFGIMVAFTLLFPISTILVGARIWVRKRITHNLSWEDVLLVVAHLMTMANGICFLVLLNTVGYDKRNISELQLHTMYLVGINLYAGAAVLVKFSIAGFFLGVAKLRWQRWAATLPLVMYCITMVPLIFIVSLRCGPGVNAIDILTRPDCPISATSFKVFGLLSTIVNMISDWLFAVIPAHMFYLAPSMNRRTKWSAVFVMSLALIASVVSVIRIPTFIDAHFGPDFLYDYSLLSFLSIVETLISIIAISLVTLKPLLNGIKARRRPSSKQASALRGPGMNGSKAAWMWTFTARVSRRAGGGRVGRLGVLPDTTFGSVMATVRDTERDAMDDSDPLPSWPPAQSPWVVEGCLLPEKALGTVHETGVGDEESCSGAGGGTDEPDAKTLETLALAVKILPLP